MAELTPNQIEVAAKAMFECCAEENIIMREHLWNQTRGSYRRMVIAAFAALQPELKATPIMPTVWTCDTRLGSVTDTPSPTAATPVAVPPAWMFDVGNRKDFVVFDAEEMTDEEVVVSELQQIRAADGSPYRSQAWSCNVEWYFVVSEQGIALLNVRSGLGYLCLKKTWKLIELFLDGKVA